MGEEENSCVGIQRKGKRVLGHDSESEDMGEKERVVRRKTDQEGLKMIVKFKEGHYIKTVSPMGLSKFLREKNW